MEPSNEAISVRIARLNNLFLNKTTANAILTNRHWVSREGLLDALIVLYDECNNDTLKRDKHIANFVDRFRCVVTELRRLRVNITDFEVKKVIGRGHFGEVHVVREKQSGDVYAMKKLRKSDTLSQQSVAFYEEERDIMAYAASPWLTSLQYAFQDMNHLYLVMEFHPGGDLLALLERFDGSLSEDMAKFYLAELTLSIHSLHSMNYVHRDIKPDNILVDRCGHLKLADFGSAAKLNGAGIVMSEMPVGTPEYIAPEVLAAMESMGKGNNKRRTYGVECDYWSLGIVAYEMIFGHTPFSGDRLMSTYCNIMNHKENLSFPEDHEISAEFHLLVLGLLKAADQRLRHEQLLQHKFFSSVDWNGIRDTMPPFVPVVNGQDDTSNFVEFDHEAPTPSIANFKVKREFSGQNLPFIGFTYAPDFFVSSSSECSILPKKGDEDLEMILASKQKKIQELQMRLHNTERGGGDKNKEIEALEKKMEEKDMRLQKLEHDRNHLENDLTKYVNETMSLKRLIEFERKERIDMEGKTIELVSNAKQKWKWREEQKVAQFLNEMKNKEMALADSNYRANELSLALKKKEEELVAVRIESESLHSIISEHKNKIAKVQENRRSSVAGMENRLEQLTLNGEKQIDELQSHLEAERNLRIESENKLYHLEEAIKEQRIAWVIQGEETETHRREVERLASKLNEVDCKLERANHACQNLRSELKQSQLQESKIRDEQMRMLENALLKEKNDCRELQCKLLKVEGELSESLMSIESHHESVLSEKMTTVTQLEVELKEAEKEKVHLKHKIQEAENREREYQEKVATLEIMFTRLEENLAKLTGENEKLKGSDKKTKTYDNTEQKNVLQQENHLLSAQLKKLENQMDKLKEQMILDKQAVKSTQSDLWKKEKELNDAKIDLRIAKREVKTAEEQIKTLQDEKKKMSDALSSEKNEHFKILSIKSEQISSLEKEIIDYKEKMQILQADFISFQEKACCEKQLLEAKVQSLTISVSEATSTSQNLGASQKMCKDLESQVRKLEKNEREWNEKIFKAETQIKSTQADLVGAKRRMEALELNGGLLRQACVEMEEQLEDYQKLVSAHETKELIFEEERKGLMGQLEKEHAESIRWKRSFEHAEIKLKELELQLNELSQETQERDVDTREEIEALKAHCFQYKSLSDHLTEQVNNLEEQLNSVSQELRSAERQEEVLRAEGMALKEESARHLTHIHSLRESNFKLTSDLEEALSNCHSLRVRVDECEAVTGELQALYRQREVKMEATIKQQSKLIDYLQSMNEGKKKKTLSDRLFGSNTTNGMPAPSTGIRNRELEAQLSTEKAKNKRLMDDFMRAKAELLAIQDNMHRGNNPDLFRKSSTLPVPVTPKSKQVISQLVQSPDAQTPSRKPSLQRMHHKIPHRFEMKMNMRPVKCAACLDSVHFGRHAAVCQECAMVAHPKCSLLLPTTCGLPFQFVRHFSETWKNGVDGNDDSSSNESASPKMEGWVKLLKRGKACWERKYLRLEGQGQVLKVYDHQPMDNLSPVQTFELSSPEGSVATVLGAVPLSEVINTAKSDLPYILKVELGSGTTCWPGGSSLLIMALSFPEKQAWVSSLESAVTVLKNANPEREGTLNLQHYHGEVVSHLHGDHFLSLNCCLQLSNELLLLGAEEGLYSLQMNHHKISRNHPVRILGVDCVYQIMLLPSVGLAVMIAGESRQLVQVDLRELQVAAEAAECARPKVSYIPLEGGLESVHLFAAQASNPYDHSAPAVLCAASSDRIAIMKWHADQSGFMLCKVMETAEPCSCLHFAPHSVIVGCDKFFEVDLKDYSVEEFLDASDTSLAYAVLGTHQLNSFPVAVLDISSSLTNPEYLLCFHEFAVFVDAYGRRTREVDVKWSHISFAFAFQKPYLFIFHFALVEVLRITPKSFTVSGSDSNTVIYPQQALLELPNPQLLGTSITPGTVFLSSSSDIKFGELLKLKGSLACPGVEGDSSTTLDTYGLQSVGGDGDSSDQVDPSEFSFTLSVVQTLEETDDDDGLRGAGGDNSSKGATRRVQFESNMNHLLK